MCMERLELIDDIRKYAVFLMSKDPNLSYDEATKQAKIKLVGYDIKIASYQNEEQSLQQELKNNFSYKDTATKEINFLKVELYTDEQLKEMIIANRMGVNLESFINIFYTPAQIRFITLMSAAEKDITPYTTNVCFDPEEEMKKIDGTSGESDPLEGNKQFTLSA